MSYPQPYNSAAAAIGLDEEGEDLFPEGSTPPHSPQKKHPQLPPHTPVRVNRGNFKEQLQRIREEDEEASAAAAAYNVTRKRVATNVSYSDGTFSSSTYKNGWGNVEGSSGNGSSNIDGQHAPPNVTWLHKRKKTAGPPPNKSREEGGPYVPKTPEERLQSRPDYPPSAKLEMFHFTILYYVPLDGLGGNFFELINPARPDTPLRLYRNSMVNLCEKLPKAIKEIKNMENASGFSDDTQIEVAVIHQFKNTRVILSVGIYSGTPSIWLRLYAKNEEGEIIPSTYAVKFSLADNVQKLYDFVIEHK